MRTKIAVIIALLAGVVLGLSLQTRVHAQAAGVPPTYQHRSVYLEIYTPADVTSVADQNGAEGFRLSGVIQTTPFGSALLVFERQTL